MLSTHHISPPIFNGVRIVNRPDPENIMRIDLGAMPMISAMETAGIRINPDHIIKLHKRLTFEMEGLAAKVEDLTGKHINIGSGDQLAHLLFKDLKLKQLGSREKWTKSRKRLATDSDVLKAMLSQHPVVKVILDWKEREKLRSTYTLSLLAKADDLLRIHTDFSNIGADTGRLTSSDPNLQNIPIRTELGNEIRNAFVPKKGYVIGSADASQIEMRMNAHDARCERMLMVFWDREDVYWDNAELIYHREFTKEQRLHGIVNDPEAPDSMQGAAFKKWYRQNAKVFALMVGYDASAGAVYDQFLSWGIPGWTEDLCAQGLIDYFDGYPELLDRRRELHYIAMRYGFVWDLFGRIRMAPQFKSCHPRIRGEGERQAGNLPGQGGAASVIKLWMAKIWQTLLYGPKQWHKHITMLIQIHDELVCEGERAAVQDFQAEEVELLRTLLPYSHFSSPMAGSMETGEVDAPWGSLPH